MDCKILALYVQVCMSAIHTKNKVCVLHIKESGRTRFMKLVLKLLMIF